MPTLMTPAETAAAMERNLARKTGRTLEQWIGVLREANRAGSPDAAAWLKADQGLGHFQAQLVARAASGKRWTEEYEDPAALLDALYAGSRAPLRALHEAVFATARRLGKDVRVSVCKTYASAYRRRQFLIAKPKRAGLEVTLSPGRDRGERKVLLTAARDLDAALRAELRRAYEGAA